MEESDVLESDGDVSNDAVLLEDAVMYVQEKIYRSGRFLWKQALLPSKPVSRSSRKSPR